MDMVESEMDIEACSGANLRSTDRGEISGSSYRGSRCGGEEEDGERGPGPRSDFGGPLFCRSLSCRRATEPTLSL